MDGDVPIKGVVAVDVDSDTPPVTGDTDSPLGKRDSKRRKDSKRSSSSRKSSKRESNHSDKDEDRKSDSGVTSGETSVIYVRSSAHDSESDERSSKTDDTIEAGATPYPDGDTTRTTIYTTVIRHHVDGTGEDDDVRSDSSKRISNVSSRSSSTPHVISTYDPTEEGHFHSEHQYNRGTHPWKENIQHQ